MIIPFDFDQYQWLSRTRYPDHTKLPWRVDKTVLHWGGHTNPGESTWTLERKISYEMAILRGWQRMHMASPRNWTDIAYGYAVGNSGMRYRLRGENRQGATSGDYDGDGIPENHEARSIVWIGGLSYRISKAAFASMGTMIDSLMPVILHFEVKATACPGKGWEAWRDRKGWEDDSSPITRPPTGEYKMRVVRYGMGSKLNRDATVAAMQRGMTVKGFRDKRTIDTDCGADGIARSGTETQIKDFQQAFNLVADGICGDSTWAEIDKE